MQRIKRHFLIIIFLIFYFAVTAYKFIANPAPFYDWDESIYAQVGREMIRNRSIVPLWQDQYWLDKPPLAPLAYGIVQAIIPLNPELSTRFFTLLITVCIFSLIYYFYYRLTKNELISFLTVVISSFTPVFLQRAQVLNVDIFLFLGWMGYLVFYKHFWLSFLFLSVGVLSKSLLGFYPVMIMGGIYVFQYLTKSLSAKEFFRKIKYLIIQLSILLLWYVGMFLYFKYPFIQAHFFDSHLKRITASIESHFGKRTFYIDALAQQLGIFFYLSIISFFIVVYQNFRKFIVSQKQKISLFSFLFSIFFVPWFIFLNLTKTKISWYLYPVIPQFAFLGVYFLDFIKKKKVVFLISIIITALILNKNFSNNLFFGTQYSSYDEYYQLAVYAKNHCQELNIFVDKDSRNTHYTLKNMGLLIGTSEWWGNHPAIVYYSDKKVNFIYETGKFEQKIYKYKTGKCFVIDNFDLEIIPKNISFSEKRFNNLILLIP